MSPGWCRYVQGQRHLERLVREVGAHKLMWGSDSPYGMTAWCTYLLRAISMSTYPHSL